METLSSTISSVPFDWFIVGAIVVVLIIDSLRSGIGRTLALALAAPIASFLYSLKDTAFLLKDIGIMTDSSNAQAVFFGIALIASFMLLRRMGIEFYESGIGEPIQATMAASAAAAVIVLVWVHTPALQTLYEFGPQIQALFAETYRMWWVVGTLATLAFVRG